MWTEITDGSGINRLLETYSNFQDSCIRDIYISMKEFVDDSLVMGFSNKLSASLLFQREFKPNAVIELKFEDVERFNFLPFNKTESPVIYDATLKMENGLFYWADIDGWTIDNNDSIWISGKKLFWRLIPELIGNIKRISED